MRFLKILSGLCCAVFLLATDCSPEPVATGDPVCVLFETSDTLLFDRIYAPDHASLYQDLKYIYDDERIWNSVISLPLSAYEDSVTYVFRQGELLDTLVVGYKQEVDYDRHYRVYYRDHKILYTTFQNVKLNDIGCYY